MPGNGHVFISHAHEDDDACAPLLAALTAWGVDYWFDTQRLSAGQDLSSRIQQAIAERDIFIRVCTPAAQRSYWVQLETGAFRALQARAHREGRGDTRLLINLILDPAYTPDLFDYATLFIDATHLPVDAWLDDLRRAFGLPAHPAPPPPLPAAASVPLSSPSIPIQLDTPPPAPPPSAAHPGTPALPPATATGERALAGPYGAYAATYTPLNGEQGEEPKQSLGMARRPARAHPTRLRLKRARLKLGRRQFMLAALAALLILVSTGALAALKAAGGPALFSANGPSARLTRTPTASPTATRAHTPTPLPTSTLAPSPTPEPPTPSVLTFTRADAPFSFNYLSAWTFESSVGPQDYGAWDVELAHGSPDASGWLDAFVQRAATLYDSETDTQAAAQGAGLMNGTEVPGTAGTRTFAGETWQYRESTWIPGGTQPPLHEAMYVCHHAGHVYHISLIALDSEFASARSAEFPIVINSFQFTS